MFSETNVKDVIEELKKSPKYFSSEAHLQMSFILEAYKKFNNDFDFYPEYSMSGQNGKKDEIDLYIKDKKSGYVTLIEFKYKTTNTDNLDAEFLTPYGVKITPKKQDADNLAKYDCWKDVSRLEYHLTKLRSDGIKTNGFFIFLTNQKRFWENDGENTMAAQFSLKDKSTHGPNEEKDWPKNNGVYLVSKKSVEASRYDNPITIGKFYELHYIDFQKTQNNNSIPDEFKMLILPIKLLNRKEKMK